MDDKLTVVVINKRLSEYAEGLFDNPCWKTNRLDLLVVSYTDNPINISTNIKYKEYFIKSDMLVDYYNTAIIDIKTEYVLFLRVDILLKEDFFTHIFNEIDKKMIDIGYVNQGYIDAHMGLCNEIYRDINYRINILSLWRNDTIKKNNDIGVYSESCMLFKSKYLREKCFDSSYPNEFFLAKYIFLEPTINYNIVYIDSAEVYYFFTLYYEQDLTYYDESMRISLSVIANNYNNLLNELNHYKGRYHNLEKKINAIKSTKLYRFSRKIINFINKKRLV